MKIHEIYGKMYMKYLSIKDISDNCHNVKITRQLRDKIGVVTGAIKKQQTNSDRYRIIVIQQMIWIAFHLVNKFTRHFRKTSWYSCYLVDLLNHILENMDQVKAK